jgi:hypothetical protein
MKNQPYIKNFENGILTNPITKENPYLQSSSNKGGRKFRKSYNQKGIGLIVRRIGFLTFEKLYIRHQFVKNKIIFHLNNNS